MMDKLIEEYGKILEGYLKEDSLDIDLMIKDNRMDEANHKKAERNVVDIFARMLVISKQQANGNKDKFSRAFLAFFDKIPQNWYSNLEKCKAHGNEDEQLIEERKIARKDEIKRIFIEMM